MTNTHTPAPARTPRRMAKYRITMQDLAYLLTLPHGVNPVLIYGESDPPAVYLVVQSDAFPELPPDAVMPLLHQEYREESIDVNGVRYARRLPARTAEQLGQTLPDYQ